MTDRLEVEFDADGKVDVDALRARIDRRVMDGRAADAEAEVADLVRKADDALAAALASEQAAVDFLKAAVEASKRAREIRAEAEAGE